MAIHDLKGRIARLPEQPGVYLFANDRGELLYVGKARVLRDRVRTYLAAEGVSPRIDALLREAAALDVIVTDSVVEALALENRLIKQRQPRYNVLLRDDKTYPYLQLTTAERAPRLLVARRVERDGNVYAGPFMPAAMARRTMAIAHRLFGIRSCNEIIDGRRDRPCLEYDIKRCLAPCVESICSIDRYRRAVEQARLLIEGRQDELVASLQTEMIDAATSERFERAAHLRDAIRTIETLRDRQQKLESPSMGDRDVFGLRVGPAGAVVHVFQIRRGRIRDRIDLATADRAAALAASGTADAARAPREAEVLATALQHFYTDHDPPPSIIVPIEPADGDAIGEWLAARAARAVRLAVPQRGDARGLLDLAMRNAALAYAADVVPSADADAGALAALQAVLALPTLPRRIEAFDISTLHGRETVGSMIVARDGRLRRGEYRKFRIRGRGGDRSIADDFAAMHEVVLRRYRHVLEQGGPFPDLLVIDGGKGQLTAAYQALREVGLDRLVAVGIAKREELLFTRDRTEGLALAGDSAALRLLQRIRDEAHRFAVTFHRRSRTKADLRSELDEIAGIGPRRRRELLTAFGSVAGIRRASREELSAVVGARAAEAIIRHFEP